MEPSKVKRMTLSFNPPELSNDGKTIYVFDGTTWVPCRTEEDLLRARMCAKLSNKTTPPPIVESYFYEEVK